MWCYQANKTDESAYGYRCRCHKGRRSNYYSFSTFDVYAEPFAASGRYVAFGETLAGGARDLRLYGEDGTMIERLEDGSYVVTDGDDTFTLPNRDFNVREQNLRRKCLP